MATTTITTEEEVKPTVQKLLSATNPQDIVSFLGGIYEHSAWVAEQFVATFNDKKEEEAEISSVSDLAAALKTIVNDASREQNLALLRAHPDLCEKVDKLAELTQYSQHEQSNSGLLSLTVHERATFSKLNTQYREKCNFPFILAVRNATKYTVLAALQGRVNNSTAEQEFVVALEQVHKIAWMRLLSKINTDNAKGFLTCHVLDTANGCPAKNMRIELHRLESAGMTTTTTKRIPLGTYVTNDDGRLPGGRPALQGGKEFTTGVYEWTFYVGDYFASKGMHSFTSGQPFLDVVPLRFGIDNPDDHYHVPLLVSPWSFSTYRGS